MCIKKSVMLRAY